MCAETQSSHRSYWFNVSSDNKRGKKNNFFVFCFSKKQLLITFFTEFTYKISRIFHLSVCDVILELERFIFKIRPLFPLPPFLILSFSLLETVMHILAKYLIFFLLLLCDKRYIDMPMSYLSFWNILQFQSIVKKIQ